MLKSLVTLGLSLVFLFLGPNRAFGQSVQLSETIKIDPAANFEVTPEFFCVMGRELFLFTDHHTRSIKIFVKRNNFLKFKKTLGPWFGNKFFIRPMFCFFSRDKKKIGVYDSLARKVFIFETSIKNDFILKKTVDCRKFGYDMAFTKDSDQLIVSGYITDKDENPFDLYSININKGYLNYLLPSYQKYHLKDFEVYVSEYREKHIIPSIGIKAYIDIHGDKLFFVWEGEPRIIKINLRTQDKTVFGKTTSHFAIGDKTLLSKFYNKGELKKWEKLREERAYIRNIFTTSKHVFLIYETGKNNECSVSTFRVQIYTPEGKFLNDVKLPGNMGRKIWFDKDNYNLYALSIQHGNKKKELLILKYKLEMTKKSRPKLDKPKGGCYYK